MLQIKNPTSVLLIVFRPSIWLPIPPWHSFDSTKIDFEYLLQGANTMNNKPEYTPDLVKIALVYTESM
jgi:hypothetical protein